MGSSRLADNGRSAVSLNADADLSQTLVFTLQGSRVVTYDNNFNRRATHLVLSTVFQVQFFGAQHVHGTPFTRDYFKLDTTGFTTPTRLLWLSTDASHATAPRFSARRMVKEYAESMYGPALRSRESVSR